MRALSPPKMKTLVCGSEFSVIPNLNLLNRNTFRKKNRKEGASRYILTKMFYQESSVNGIGRLLALAARNTSLAPYR